jgi:inorganic pyrophosphatase
LFQVIQIFFVFDPVTDASSLLLAGIREWFRWYKVPSGKPLNKFEFSEMCLSATAAHDVVKETHGHWRRLVRGEALNGKMWTAVSEPPK